MDLDDVAGVYARMQQAWKVQGHKALGGKLGKKMTTVRGAKSTKRVPDEYIWHTVAVTGCRLEWLCTGDEPMFPDDLRVNQLPPPVRRMVEATLKIEDAESLYALEVCTHLFAAHNELPKVQSLKGVIIGYEDHLQQGKFADPKEPLFPNEPSAD